MLTQREAASRLSLSVKTLGAWVVAERKGTLAKVGETQKPQSELEAELARVKRELATVTMEREILKKATVYFAKGLAVKYDRIEAMRQEYPIAVLCRVFGVGASSYYAWRRRAESSRARENAWLEVQIAAAHGRTRHTYGRERLQADLSDHGVRVGLHRIRRIRSKLGLRCKQKRKFRNTTDSKHDLPVAPNLLERDFDMGAPNEAWVSDITYLWTDEGWLYLAGIKDLFNGELVGYAMSERMTRSLVMQALFSAVSLKRSSGHRRD